MKLKKSAVKHLKQKAKRPTGDAKTAKKSRIRSKGSSTSIRRSEHLSQEDPTENSSSGFIKLKNPSTKDNAGKRYLIVQCTHELLPCFPYPIPIVVIIIIVIIIIIYVIHECRHTDELKDLERSDPEFFKFLKDNDTSLLEFVDSDDDANDMDDEEGDEMDAMDSSDEDGDGEDIDFDEDGEDVCSNSGAVSSSSNRQRDRKKIQLTAELVSSTADKSLHSDSLTELKKLLSMFRAACMPNGESVDPNDEPSEVAIVSKYVVPSAEVYEYVMLTTINTVSRVFGRLLDIRGPKDTTRAHLDQLSKHGRWKKLQLCVVSYFKSVLHTLDGLVDSSQSRVAEAVAFLVDSLGAYIPFLAPLPRLAKSVVKVLLAVWSRRDDLSTDRIGVPDMQVRCLAFLRIRQMAVELPGAVTEECFRSMYLKFARQTKSFNEYTAPSEMFMMQSVAELYGTDLSIAYQQAFLYIRQLALHLRAALLKKTDETNRQVSGMQFLNCLRLWTRVVCSYPSAEGGLGALAFPLVQVILGAVSTNSASIYFTPLKFNMLSCLHQLAASCRVFIPTTSHIMETLENPELVSKAAGSTDLAPRLEYLVRLPPNAASKAVCRDAIVQEAVQLLRQDVEIYRFHVGFPEYVYLVVRRLKSFLKKCKIPKWRDQLRTLVGQIEQYSAVVQRARKDLTAGPMSVTDFEPLLKADNPCAQERLCKLITSGRKEVGVALSDASAVSRISVDSRPAADAKHLFAASFRSVRSKNKSPRSKKGTRVDNSNADDGGSGDCDVQIDEDDSIDGSQRMDDASDVSPVRHRSALISKQVETMQDDTVEELDWEDDD